MQGSVLAGEESPGAQGAAQLPRGGSKGCHPHEGRSCPHLHCPPSSSPKASAKPGLKLFTSACASLGKTVASKHIHPSPALLQVRFTPREPQLRALAAIPSHKSASLPQLAKARCDKSKTNPKPPHFLTRSTYSLVSLCNLQFHSSSKVVYKNINSQDRKSVV